MKSLGLIETYGLLAGIEAADAAMKSANVQLVGYESARGSGMTTIKVEGDVGAVKAAIASAEAAVAKIGRVASVKVIPRPASGLESMIRNEQTVGYEQESSKPEPDPEPEPPKPEPEPPKPESPEPAKEAETEKPEPEPEPPKVESVKEPEPEPPKAESVKELEPEPPKAEQVKEPEPEPVKEPEVKAPEPAAEAPKPPEPPKTPKPEVKAPEPVKASDAVAKKKPAASSKDRAEARRKKNGE